PISIMKSYALLLERRGQSRPEVFDEAVHAIDSEADRMQLLVEQMLLSAKNQEVSNRSDTNLISLLEEVRNTFTRVYTREISLKTRYDSVLVNADKDQFKQVIFILLDNALKYSEDKVILEISEMDQQAIIKVIDSGDGISA